MKLISEWFYSRAYVQLDDIKRGSEPLDESDVDDDDGVDDDRCDRGGCFEDEEGGEQIAESVDPGVTAVTACYVRRIEGAASKTFDPQKHQMQVRNYYTIQARLLFELEYYVNTLGNYSDFMIEEHRFTLTCSQAG